MNYPDFFVFHSNSMKQGEVLVHIDNYNFINFYGIQKNNKKVFIMTHLIDPSKFSLRKAIESTKNIKIHMEHPILIRKKLLCYGHGNKKKSAKMSLHMSEFHSYERITRTFLFRL